MTINLIKLVKDSEAFLKETAIEADAAALHRRASRLIEQLLATVQSFLGD